MARNILIHPGFHRTGTSSVQHFLWSNRARLAPHADILLMRHLQAAVRVCMYFSETKQALALTDLVEIMDAALAAHLPQGAAQRDLIISCEGLSGHMPGRPGTPDYAAAPVVAAYLAGYFAARQPQAKVSLVYTTRAGDAWLNSIWRAHVANRRMTDDWPAFQGAHRAAADLDAVAGAVAAAVAPVPVFALPLDEAQAHPQGPGGALLELLPMPDDLRASLQPVGIGSRGPDAALTAQLLRLNRSDQDDAALRAEKARLITEAEVGGWTKV